MAHLGRQLLLAMACGSFRTLQLRTDEYIQNMMPYPDVKQS